MRSTADEGTPGITVVPDVLPRGAQAGPWRVERELGRGGMGAVYAVVHDTIGKRAALKVVHGRLLGTGFNPDRMLIEARVVNQVGHPNIVDIFETGKLADGRPYIVMERLDGQPLSARADAGKIRADIAVDILLQICDALVAAHAAGIIHRDLKLDNVFLVDNDDDPSTVRVKLLDWGIAKVIAHDVRHTVEGQLVGTPQYLAPEQARGLQVSPKADVYSLGVMAYELFLEQLPFEAETAAEVMTMHLRATPPPPRELWPDIPPQLEALLIAMLAKHPDHRPTMMQVAQQLDAVREELLRRRRAAAGPNAPEEPVRATPAAIRRISAAGRAATEPAEWRPRQPRWHYAVGAAALVAGVALFLFTRTGDSTAAAATAAPLGEAPAAAAAPQPLLGDPGAPSDAPITAATVTGEPGPVERTVDRGTGAIGGAAAPIAALAPVAARAEPPRAQAHRPAPVRARAAAASASPIRSAPAAPRRSKLDPDGTVDPYR